MEWLGVVGGDRRQLYAARALEAMGYPTALWGLEGLEEARGFPTLPPQEMGARCGAVVLPVPATRDGRTLNAPYAREPIPLDGPFAQALSGCPVLGGMVEKLRQSSPLWEKAPLLDYFQREEVALGNAFLTAEGALALAIRHSPGALGGSPCLVTGFGRIGKALCLALRGLGAQVSCAARKPQDLAAIRALGCAPAQYGSLPGGQAVVFNTVPAPVLGEEALARQLPGTLLLELASAPGGIDRAAARRLGLQVVDGSGLPGRFAPQAAGELIAGAVNHMLEERRNHL